MIKDLLSISQLSKDNIYELLTLAAQLKNEQKKGIEHNILKGKSLGMLFEKASTRTRLSFEIGMSQLGGTALFLSNKDLQIGRGEPICDTARVFSRYLDGIMIRTYGHEIVEEFAKYADIPVINGLTDLYHPCQALTDLFTIQEFKGTELMGLKLAYVGDGNNMAHSLMLACSKVGIDCIIASPKGYEPKKHIIKMAKDYAIEQGSILEITNDPELAVKDADIIYTDVWASMGQEELLEARRKIFEPFQVNNNLLSLASYRAIVMHCLPAHRGEEITEQVLEANSEVIFTEAENRLHTQKAILATLLNNN